MYLRKQLRCVALALVTIASCSDERGAWLDSGTCAAPAQFLYVDRACSVDPGDAASSSCEERGDGRCYRRCSSDGDCPDPRRPFCTQIGLFAGTDYSCTTVVTVCRESRSDWCKQ